MTKRFRIQIECDVVLDTKALWPDGDAHENPTAGDVHDLIHGCGGPERILRDWNLEDECDVHVTEERES